MTELNAVLDAATKDFDNSLERLFKLVRIPSISTSDFRLERRSPSQRVAQK